MKIKIKYLVILITLTGCTDKYDSRYEKEVLPVLLEIKKSYKPQIVDGVKEPDHFPDLEEDKKTLLGIDSNKDGVRDDIEIYINRTYKTEPERWSMKESHRILSQRLDDKKRNADERNLISNNASYVYYCPTDLADENLLKLDKGKYYDLPKPTTITLNTGKRLERYNSEYSEMAGKTYGPAFADRIHKELCMKLFKK